MTTTCNPGYGIWDALQPKYVFTSQLKATNNSGQLGRTGGNGWRYLNY